MELQMTLRACYNNCKEQGYLTTDIVWFGHGYHEDRLTGKFIDEQTELHWKDVPEKWKNKRIGKHDWWLAKGELCVGKDECPWPKN